MNFVDIIKNSIKLSDVVSQKVKLTKKGNSIIGLCPFHGEKTPSFTVNDEKGLYYCFGCGASGDVIQFTCDINALDFKEAVNYLAEIYGIDIPKNVNNKVSLNPILEVATLWFEKQLYSNLVAVEYIKHRKITNDIIKKFRLGYAPVYGLSKYLLSQGFNVDDIKDAGLLNSQNQDYFYNRVIFPICNSSGSVIGFGGRSIVDTQNPKYLNSKGTVYFQKRENLYASHFAVREARKQGKIIVVEGYMDVLMLHQVGISNAVGLLGTSMTTEHLIYLWGITSEIIVWMDGDVAGKMASVKTASLALSLIKPGCVIKFVDVVIDADPYDICINQGADSVVAILDSAKLLSEFIWNYEFSKVISNNNSVMPEECVMLEARAKYYIEQIADGNVAKYYKKYFYSQIYDLQYSKNRTKSLNNRNVANGLLSDNKLKHKTAEFLVEEYNQLRVIYIIMEFPELLDDPIIFDQFSQFKISNENMYRLQQYIMNIKITFCDHTISKEMLLLELEKNNLSHIVDFVLKKMESSRANFIPLKNREYNMDIAKKEIEKIMLLEQLKYIQAEILDLRLTGKNDIAEKLSNQAQEIDNKLRELWNY
ncbi:DNA primase [Ehrlichia sp. JZT12]